MVRPDLDDVRAAALDLLDTISAAASRGLVAHLADPGDYLRGVTIIERLGDHRAGVVEAEDAGFLASALIRFQRSVSMWSVPAASWCWEMLGRTIHNLRPPTYRELGPEELASPVEGLRFAAGCVRRAAASRGVPLEAVA